MAEYLSIQISAEMVVGYFPGIKATRGVDAINYALFADESLLLGGDSLNIARAFNEILQNFCLISRALINKRNSDVFGWNVDHLTIL